jgi:hypothetical protein
VTDEDWSHYFGDPPAAVIGGLALTGGQVGALWGALAAVLVVGGSLLFFAGRRRRRNSPDQRDGFA